MYLSQNLSKCTFLDEYVSFCCPRFKVVVCPFKQSKQQQDRIKNEALEILWSFLGYQEGGISL